MVIELSGVQLGLKSYGLRDFKIERGACLKHEMAKWRNDEMAKWRNGAMAKWRNDIKGSNQSDRGNYRYTKICIFRLTLFTIML